MQPAMNLHGHSGGSREDQPESIYQCECKCICKYLTLKYENPEECCWGTSQQVTLASILLCCMCGRGKYGLGFSMCKFWLMCSRIVGKRPESLGK